MSAQILTRSLSFVAALSLGVSLATTAFADVLVVDRLSNAVYAALVAPLGDIKLRMYDPSSGDWK